MADTLERLHSIVEAEREALLAGDFERLSQLLPEKESALVDLRGADSTHASLGALRKNIERNQALFDRALAGVRAVVTRIAEFGEVRKTIGTYDASGKRQTIEMPQHANLEKRA